MRKWLCCLTLLLVFSSWSFAEEQILDVSVYKQGLVLNGEKLSNTALQYPMLFYKDVVYMPLSSEMGKLAGFKATWSEADKSLDLDKEPPLTSALASGVYTHPDQVKASVSSSQIKLEDEILTLGTFPALVYQHVTYIPLSWELTHNRLGWETAHHSYVGLIIQSDGKRSAADVLKDFNVRYYEALAAFMRTRNGGYTTDSSLAMVKMLKGHADTHAIDEKWIMALWWQESNFNTGSISGHGALGAMQIMPDTGRRLGYTQEQLLDPNYNVEAGTRYLAGLRNTFSGDVFLATVAYNQGSTRVSRGSYNPRFGYEVQKKYDAISAYVQNYLLQ